MRFELCDSKVALSIVRMRFGWRFCFLRFYVVAIRLNFLFLAAEFLSIPARHSGNRAIRDSRFCATKAQRLKISCLELSALRRHRNRTRDRSLNHMRNRLEFPQREANICYLNSIAKGVAGLANPKGSKTEKNSRFPFGIEISGENKNFKRATHQGPPFCEKHFEGQD